MGEGAVGADVQLTGWHELMASDNPLRVVRWLAAGAKQNESMVVHHLRLLQRDLLESMPGLDSRIYTNCVDVEGWRGSYVVPHESSATPLDHVFQIQTHVVSAMNHEEGLTADLYVTNGLASAWALYGLGLAMWNTPLPPVIAVMAKSPEEMWDYVTPRAAVFMLRSLAHCDTFWLLSLDNEREVQLMRELCTAAGAPLFPRIRRARTYSWEDRSAWRGKEDVVVWSGRMSRMKNVELAVEVFALLPEVKKEMFSPQIGRGRPDHENARRIENTAVHVGEPPEIYRMLTRRSKVLLITSYAEGLPAGFIELMGQGSVPVVWDRGWIGDLLPEDWPLRFRTAGEGAEMVLQALAEYPGYARKLRSWMGRRFGAPINFAELVDEVWRDYTIQMGDKMRVVTGRGTRKSL